MIKLLPSDRRIGICSLIGIILLASGLPLILYHRSVDLNISGLYTLSFENSYSFNTSIFLNQGDRLLLYVSPLKQVNYSLIVNNSLENLVLNTTQIDKTLLISVNFTELHTLIVKELPPLQYTQIRFEVIRYASIPVYNYIFLGMPLTIAGLTLSFTSLRGFKYTREGSGPPIRFNLRDFSMITIFLLSYAVMLVTLTTFIIDIIFQNWFWILVLIFFSLINIISVYKISTTFPGEKFKPLSIILLVLAYLWIPLSIISLLQSQALIFNYYDVNNILTFNLIREFTLNYTSVYFQMMLFILIPPVFYVYLSYTSLEGAYPEASIILSQRPVEATFHITLRNNLVDYMNKRDLAGFFEALKDISVEAAAILFLVSKEYVENKNCDFTYHKLLLNYKELFNKKLYERKPVETFLTPLDLVKTAPGRFKIFKLNTEAKEVKFIVNQLNELKGEGDLSLLESAAGVTVLRERKVRFSGEG
ncbi:MAG: hypothetical protein OdinLCB4_004995 [Candidatus Odinarchaeum yellowstonii]|uniref:Uncharacterized protein n=1 Tax=Odinarchaeota yellowstonii (strain LCB_4) TaxID=1841599 RepID=A0AAF0D1C5_ODILC|nr:MAG: hypothetical protein OdinLCB4_004995 [Candidatus Odinarchaeum yellowstonii]